MFGPEVAPKQRQVYMSRRMRHTIAVASMPVWDAAARCLGAPLSIYRDVNVSWPHTLAQVLDLIVHPVDDQKAPS